MTKNPSRLARRGVCLAALLASAPVFAINGIQLGGYGVKNSAMGGAAIALPLDAEAAANNPAGLALLPASYSLDLVVFNGESTADYLVPGNRLQNQTTIAIPSGGIIWKHSEQVTFGLSVAAQGTGADYQQVLLPVPGADQGKSSLKVVEVLPTVAWKPAPDWSLGVSLNLAYSTLDVSGVIVPAPVPGGLLPLPTHGAQSATGAGLRLGALWQTTPDLRLGVSYKSRTRMGKFSGYKDDLLAYSDGRLDLPEQFGVGLAWDVSQNVTVAADWLRIQYSDLKVMQDPNGFGWRDQPVLRLGASWAVHPDWTVRVGASRSRSPIGSARVAQNVLTPSLFDRTFTLGASWRANRTSEFNAALEVNPRRSLTGTGASAGADLSAKAYILMLGYQHSFD